MQRLIYAAAGPGDIIRAHENWRDHVIDPGEVSLTFSSQIAQFCEDRDFTTLMISPQGDGRTLTDGKFTLEHWSRRPRHGLSYHIEQVRYGLRLLVRAYRFKANIALVDIGAMPTFMMALFRLLGLKVVVILHNTLWPSGFPPRQTIPKLLLFLDRWFFWRKGANAVIGVSNECVRQVETLAPRAAYPRFVSLAQFPQNYFQQISPPQHVASFNVLFVGRAERNKGLLDLVEMAAIVEAKQPGSVQWLVCGDGPHLGELRATVADRGLDHAFEIAGWTRPTELIAYYERSQAAIVPTRSEFAEGMAMTAIQAICAGRPLITCSVVPALEHLRSACVEAETDNTSSYAEAVMQLAVDTTLYIKLQGQCATLSEPFFDRNLGLCATLHKALD